MRDLVITGKDGNKKELFLTVSVRQLEELGDFNDNEKIELRFNGEKVRDEAPPESTVEPGKEAEIPDYNKNPDLLKPERFITIRLDEGEVLNKKKERKDADSIDRSPEDIRRIKQTQQERRDSV